MDANRLTDLPVSPSPSTSRAPTPGQAIALIVLYFVLQLAVGSAITLIAGIVGALRGGGGLAAIIPMGRH